MIWLKTALGFVSGIKMWLIVGGIVLALGMFLWLQNRWLGSELDKTQRELVDTQEVLLEMIEDKRRTYALVAARDAKILALEGKTRDLIEKIRATPVTRACASSPAIGALLDGLRNDGASETR